MPTLSYRRPLQALKSPSASTHPGLWLDKYLQSSDKDDKDAKAKLVQDVVKLAQSHQVKAAYVGYFQRYQAALANRPGPVYTATGKTQGRLSVGLGANAVLETSITLHRTYGVPYIPGSALKGLASSYAAKYLKHEAWRRAFKDGKTTRGELQKLIFGDTEESGLVIFYDALPDPKDYQLDPDVITVHHPEYYQGKGQPPADWDAPIPVPFITARGTFHFYLGLVPLPGEALENGRKVLDLAAKLLKKALEDEGVGAKTTLGYGRFAFEGTFSELEPPRSQALEKALQQASFVAWKQDIAQTLGRVAALWKDLPDADKQALEAFLKEKKARELTHPQLKRARKQNPDLDALLRTLGR